MPSFATVSNGLFSPNPPPLPPTIFTLPTETSGFLPTTPPARHEQSGDDSRPEKGIERTGIALHYSRMLGPFTELLISSILNRVFCTHATTRDVAMPDDIFSLINRLVEIFPDCFSRSTPKPLKIGIGSELFALAGVHPALLDVSRKQLRQALAFYTGSNAYRKAVVLGGARYGADGQPSGEVTPEQQEFAKTPRPKKMPATAASADRPTVDMTALLQEVMAMAISAKLDVTIKINQLPQSKPASPQTVLFAVQANNRTVVVELKNKTWNTIKEASERYPQWVAAITGQPGAALPDGGFRLENPAVQVFEKKPKPDAGAQSAAPTAPTLPIPPHISAAPTPPPSTPTPSLGRPKLSLKSRNT